MSITICSSAGKISLMLRKHEDEAIKKCGRLAAKVVVDLNAIQYEDLSGDGLQIDKGRFYLLRMAAVRLEQAVAQFLATTRDIEVPTTPEEVMKKQRIALGLPPT